MNNLRKRSGTGRISYEPLDDSAYDDEPEARESEPLLDQQRAAYATSTSSSSSVSTYTSLSSSPSPVPSNPISALLGGSLQNFLRIFNLLLEFVFHPFSPSHPSFELNALEQSALNNFKERAHLAYDTSSKDHEDVLIRLWQLSFPDDIHGHAPVSKKWKMLGFQNENPASDFRGVGIFGLQNLIYYGERYPSSFANATYRRKRSEEFDLSEYPFAITGLNITMLLFELLGWSVKAKLLEKQENADPYPPHRRTFIKLLLSQPITEAPTFRPPPFSPASSSPVKVKDLIDFGDGEQATEQPPSSSSSSSMDSSQQTISASPLFEETRAFEEVYCTAFMMLDDEWKKAKASYFQFPIVLQATKERLQKLLPTFQTLDDVLRHNQREATRNN